MSGPTPGRSLTLQLTLACTAAKCLRKVALPADMNEPSTGKLCSHARATSALKPYACSVSVALIPPVKVTSVAVTLPWSICSRVPLVSFGEPAPRSRPSPCSCCLLCGTSQWPHVSRGLLCPKFEHLCTDYIVRAVGEGTLSILTRPPQKTESL